MTTKTQTKPKTRAKIKRPASPAKFKNGLTTKRAAQPQISAPKSKTKLAIIRELVERPDGASIADLIKATKWQAHSVRAALTGLRKTGTNIVRAKDRGGVTRYCIAVPVK